MAMAPEPSTALPPLARSFPSVGPPLVAALRAGGFRKLAVQVPAGLLRDAGTLVQELRAATGAEVVLVARACFGACDFPTPDEVPGAQALVVLGHAPIPNVPLVLPTYFVEMRAPATDPERLAEAVRAAGLSGRIGVVGSVQHLELLDGLIDALGRRGLKASTATGDRRLAYRGQALGCNYTGAQSQSAEVDAFLFVGTGRFHPLGLALAVDRPVWSVDPLRGLVEGPIDRAGLLRARWLTVARARDARRFGILVSSFPGQNRTPTALALQRRAEAHGREAEILLFGRLDPRDLEGRAFEAYVNTACPRIALDDAELYPRPMLTVPEFLMVLGERPLEPYGFDTYH